MIHAPAEAATVSSTLSLSAAAALLRPVVVIGAGVAGGLAALLLALRGVSVVLIEKQRLPRYKTCGGCLNQAAIDALRQAGADDLLNDLGAVCVDRLELRHRGRRVTIGLPPGRAVSRTAFDAALVRRAIDAGAEYLDQTTASIEAGGMVRLKHGAQTVHIQAACAIVADGLAGGALREVAGQAPAADSARIGVGALLTGDAMDVRPGTIAMHCGRGGYAGLTRVEAGRVAVAAALDRKWVQQCDGPGDAVRRIIDDAGGPTLPIDAMSWKGVPQLTRQRVQVAGRRWFAVGDAAGYVEPFTGEGMAWAMTAALAVTPLAERAAKAWDDDLITDWSREVSHHRRHRQRTCHWVARVLRHPLATAAAVGLLARWPGLAQPVVRRLNRSAVAGPPRMEPT